MIEIGDLVTIKTECVGINFGGKLSWLGLVTGTREVPFDTDGEYAERVIYVLWCGKSQDYSHESNSSTYESSLAIVSKAQKKLDKWKQLELQLSKVN